MNSYILVKSEPQSKSSGYRIITVYHRVNTLEKLFNTGDFVDVFLCKLDYFQDV